MRELLLSCTAVALVACANPGDAELGATTAPIIGGALAPDDAAVVLLASFPTDRSVLATCTATVIADDVLLTAAHCVDAMSHPGWVFGMFPGPDAEIYPTLVDLEPHLLPVSEVHAHPSYNRAAPFHADIAVAILAQPTTITPLPIRRTPLTAAEVGQQARIIGYGQATVGIYSQIRRQAATLVDGLDPDDTVRVGDAGHVTCLGDSGGPALIVDNGVETVIGVDSYADNGACDTPAHFRRTDLYTAFIDTYTGGSTGPDAGVDAGTTGPDAGGDPGDDGGGCAAGGLGGGWAMLGVVGLFVARRRRR